MKPLARLAREELWTWAPPLVVALVALAFLGNYFLAISGEKGSLLTSVSSLQSQLAELQQEARELELQATRARQNEERIHELYADRLGPASQRLTLVIAEVKRLATSAGLSPSSINYTEDQLEEYGLLRKTFVFGVEGSYAELRRLIHLLESSDSFFVLEQIGLSELSGDRTELRINLRLSALFAQEDAL